MSPRKRIPISAQTLSALVAPENRYTPRIACGACFSGSCSLFEHDLFGKPLHTFPDHARCLSMICSENRYTLFRIML
jgi:hypothetical protein